MLKTNLLDSKINELTTALRDYKEELDDLYSQENMKQENPSICLMGHCQNQKSVKKDICNECYYRFKGELGTYMSDVVRHMIKRAKERNRFEVEVLKDDIYAVWPIDNCCSIDASDEQLLRFSHYYIEYYRKWFMEGKVGGKIEQPD